MGREWLMNNLQDPFAQSRPEYKNEKPDADPNDIFFSARPEVEKKIYKTPYDVKEPSKEQLKEMSPQERHQFVQDMKTEREFRQSKGFVKGTTSGLTLGLSENIPGLKPEEGDFLSGFGELIGSTVPITGIYNILGKPLVKLASKSPFAAKALESIASMAGWGITGATTEALEDAFQGKVPSAEDVLTHGAEWAVLDGILQGAGLVGKFGKWILGKAKTEKKPSWEVINDLLTDMKKEGIDVSQTDRVTAKVLSELEKPIAEAQGKEIKLSEKPKTGITLPAQEAKTDLLKNKIEPLKYEKLDTNVEALSEPYQPKEVKIDKSFENLSKDRTEGLIEELGERAETKKELGESVKSDIENRFKEERAQYEPLYKEVEEGAQKIIHSPKETINKTESILEEINSLKTRPEGYQKVINTLNDSLKDMGYHIVEQNNKLMMKLFGEVKPLAVSEQVSLSKTMELARRLGKIVDYDIIGPSIKNKIKPIITSLKTEIKAELKTASPELFEKFIEAEGKYAETANKFGKESITGIRGQEKSEKISTNLLEPTTLEHLKKVVTPAKYNQIQREIIENLRDMPFDKAKKLYRELAPHLDKNAQDAARSLITSKAPKKVTSFESLKDNIINELNKSFSTGKRPKNVLDLWKTQKGQQLVKKSLEGTKNEKEIVDYLAKQSFHDFTKSVIEPSGEINFKKFNEYLKDPAFLENLKMTGGEEAVSFFKRLEMMSNIIKFNTKKLEQLKSILRPEKGKYQLGKHKLEKSAAKAKEPSKETKKFKELHPEIKEEVTHGLGQQRLREAAQKREPIKFKLSKLADEYGFTPTIKGILSTLGIIKFTGPALGIAGTKILYKLASRKSARSSINKLVEASKKAAKSPYNITPFLLAIFDADKEIQD